MRRVAVTAVLGAVLTVLAVVPGAFARHGPQGPAPSQLDRLVRAGAPVFCGGPHKRVFALTFDDGPGPWTRSLLAALRRGRAPGTFFLVGNRIALWPAAVEAEAQAGVLGDHTWSHAHLTTLRPVQVRRQLEWTAATILTRTETQVRLFRPPYDQVDAAVRRTVRSLGLLDVRWNVDAGDSRQGARPAQVTRTILRGLKPGAIVLLHDAHPWTAKVVRRVLAATRRRHLWPVTVPRLLEVDPPDPSYNCYS
ncbi:MAG TPA: polysaccharide deacetylase family protein [Gaiellaceae bacterium]|nr:polysaccharide deacetylase family protein [Gaiellaceae bacterium]